MWKKLGGSLIVVGLCLGFSWGASVQADTATSQAGITFTGHYDPSDQTPPTPNSGGNTSHIPGSGETVSRTTGHLPITGDQTLFKEVLLGLLLCSIGIYLYQPILRRNERKKLI